MRRATISGRANASTSPSPPPHLAPPLESSNGCQYLCLQQSYRQLHWRQTGDNDQASANSLTRSDADRNETFEKQGAKLLLSPSREPCHRWKHLTVLRSKRLQIFKADSHIFKVTAVLPPSRQHANNSDYPTFHQSSDCTTVECSHSAGSGLPRSSGHRLHEILILLRCMLFQPLLAWRRAAGAASEHEKRKQLQKKLQRNTPRTPLLA